VGGLISAPCEEKDNIKETIIMIRKEQFENLKKVYKASMARLDNVKEYIRANSWDEDWKHAFHEIIELYEATVIENNKIMEEYPDLENFEDFRSVDDRCLEYDINDIKLSVDYLEEEMKKIADNMDYDLYFSDIEDMEEIGYTEEDIKFLEKNNGISVYRE